MLLGRCLFRSVPYSFFLGHAWTHYTSYVGGHFEYCHRRHAALDKSTITGYGSSTVLSFIFLEYSTEIP